MNSHSLFVFVCLNLISSVFALTNGTLLPAYICGPTNAAGAIDGYPKSLGSLLPFLVEASNPTFMTIDGVAPNGNLDACCGGSLLHTRLILANFHNKNSTTPYEKVIQVNITASNHPSYGTPKFVPTPNVIIPGRNHSVLITVTPFDLGIPSNQFCLDGAVVYAYDNNLQQRVGSFLQTGPVMQPWGACGPFNVGVVHNQLISNFNGGAEVGFYDQLVWFAPSFLVPGDTVTFKGAAVSDNGYGAHSTTHTVGIPPQKVPDPPQITQVLVLAGIEAAVFFVDQNKNAHANIAATSFTLTASVDRGGATTATLGSKNIVQSAFTTISDAPTVFTVTTTKSPAILDLKKVMNVTKLAGAVISVEVTANNAAGASSTSNYVSFVIGNYQKVPAALSLYIANNFNVPSWPTQKIDATQSFDASMLCNQQQATSVAAFSMSASDDLDNACAYQTAVTDNLAAQATGIVNPSPTDTTATTTSNVTDYTSAVIALGVISGVLLIAVLLLAYQLLQAQKTVNSQTSKMQMANNNTI